MDYSRQYKNEVQKVFSHCLTQRKNSTNQRKAVKKAQKLVEKAAKDAEKKARPKKKGRTETVPDLNVEAVDEDAEELARLQEAQEKLLQAQALIEAASKPRRTTRVSKVQAGMSIKRGCQCNFVAKQLQCDENLCTIQFHCITHTNREGKECHGAQFGGHRAGLSGHLSAATKKWIADTLRSGKSPAQVMAEHKAEVMRCAQNNLPATRDTFIMPSDVYNIANKLAKELWEKHPSDAMSVRMWTDENADCHYHYREYGTVELNEPPPPEDDPFCLAIQTEWQLEMMVRHGHRRALSMDATFSTNAPKVCSGAHTFHYVHRNYSFLYVRRISCPIVSDNIFCVLCCSIHCIQ